MNAFAFFVTTILPVQILSSSIVLRKTRPLLDGALKLKQPPCGPVPFPDFSCEELTTCITITTKGGRDRKNNEDDGPLHKRYETTCMLINMLKKNALRLGQNIVRQQPLTTSTMAPFAGGTTPSTTTTDISNDKCRGMANCHQWNWKKK